ncbi:MAG TPA: hypothetical protein DC047_01610 [Blastocatellia bacterium]|nr:hypothetical protein [Blastocatellia bacterium]
MSIKVSLILTLMLSAVMIAGQENGGLTQAERVVLDTPEVITLELAPLYRRRAAGIYQRDSGLFKPGTRIVFELVGTNTSILKLTVRGWDTFVQNRPLLFRDGQTVEYRKGLDNVLKSKEKDSAMEVTHLTTTRLEPNQPKPLEQIDLSNWYEPLPPGHYQLSTRHRFAPGGKWVESSSVTFEVETSRK